jgi:protein-disulfide isomerase
MSRLPPITPHDHVRGPASAPVTLVEYGDYQCPYCGMAHPIVKQVQKQFEQSLRFCFRHFPLTQIHPFAETAAETAEFAGAHGKFWEMHDGIYVNQDKLNHGGFALPLLMALAEALGLSPAELRDALANGEYAPKVRSDFIGGVRSGVNGTPTFFINGRRHDGTFEYADLVAAIESELAHARATP